MSKVQVACEASVLRAHSRERRSSATGMVATHLLLPQYHLKGCPPVRGYAKLCEPAHARAPERRQKGRLSRGPYDPQGLNTLRKEVRA
ncbi:hypothetical protein EVAR_56737_1 [Eumeta japonica]|uniref:Uncharacterized protein n=1 Tax=Eumeta variegata TaxID=151549 RepID=A0A4C1ZV83_EUMVA|nr:hypothetical protein EVAR_56737_1 [Eumeta japonica]